MESKPHPDSPGQEMAGFPSAGKAIRIVAGFFGGLVLLGILTAIAVPRFMDATAKGKASECRISLYMISTLEKAHRREKGRYESDLSVIGYYESRPRSQRAFTYSVEAFDSTGFRIHGKLLSKIGAAEPGDEMVLDSDGHLTATGGLRGDLAD